MCIHRALYVLGVGGYAVVMLRWGWERVARIEARVAPEQRSVVLPTARRVRLPVTAYCRAALVESVSMILLVRSCIHQFPVLLVLDQNTLLMHTLLVPGL